MSLDRFKKAQEDPVSGFATAIAELRSGRKTSHWIWYVLPQLASLGRSSTAQFYGIKDAGEAREYVRDPELRERLTEALEVIADHLGKGVPVQVLMGSAGDSAKLASCATLFSIAARTLGTGDEAQEAVARLSAACERVYEEAERQGVPRCAHTTAECSAVGTG